MLGLGKVKGLGKVVKGLGRLFSRPPPAPITPPPAYDLTTLAYTTLAVFFCWLLPLLLLLRSRRRESGGGGGGAAAGSAAPRQHRGVTLGSWMLFCSVSASAITFPFVQSRRDALGCDALCVGGQTSLRSGLVLVGAALVGRLSDRLGRLPMLYLGAFASLASLAIALTMDSIEGMWLAIIPVALLNQNFAVAKALFSDYIDEYGGSDADKTGAVGKLGMAVGFAFMAGPVLASQVFYFSTHPFLPYVAPHFSHISTVILLRARERVPRGSALLGVGYAYLGGIHPIHAHPKDAHNDFHNEYHHDYHHDYHNDPHHDPYNDPHHNWHSHQS